MYCLALCAVWLQGPSNGSPFTDAPLPFDELKAPPDTAFDILMASLAMILLSAIAAGVFLGVSKLGSIEEQLRKQAAREAAEAAEREERLRAALDEMAARMAKGAGPHGGGSAGSAGPSGRPEWVNPAVDRMVASLERLERAQKDGTSQLANTLAALAARPVLAGEAYSGSDSQVAAARDGSSASSGGDVSQEGARRSDPNSPEAISGRVTSYLAREGYQDIRVVTPPEEIDAAFVHSGQLIVEARRDGVIHKGRVSLQNGSPAAVDLRPSHSIFP